MSTTANFGLNCPPNPILNQPSIPSPGCWYDCFEMFARPWLPCSRSLPFARHCTQDRCWTPSHALCSLEPLTIMRLVQKLELTLPCHCCSLYIYSPLPHPLPSIPPPPPPPLYSRLIPVLEAGTVTELGQLFQVLGAIQGKADCLTGRQSPEPACHPSSHSPSPVFYSYLLWVSLTLCSYNFLALRIVGALLVVLAVWTLACTVHLSQKQPRGILGTSHCPPSQLHPGFAVEIDLYLTSRSVSSKAARLSLGFLV